MQVIHIGENPINFPGDDAYHYVLMSILIAARVNNLMAIDGPYSDISNMEGLVNRSKLSAALGYDGKWVIHPGQIETVNTAFTPSQAAFDGAARIIEHFTNESNNANDIYANILVIRNRSSTLSDGMYINYDSLGTTAAHLRFYANGTSERMRIDASNGYVGVGTTVPDTKFDVYDSVNGGNILVVRNANTGFMGEIR